MDEQVDLLRLVEVKKRKPAENKATVAFVPLLGFTSALYNGEEWKSTITHEKIKPTHWLEPADVYEALADHCGMVEKRTPRGMWKNEHGERFSMSKYGFKRL